MTIQIPPRPARIAALAVVVALLAMTGAAAALTVEEYVALTLSRLALAHASWTESSEPPTAAEEAALFEAAGTDSRGYYGFAAEHEAAIDAYLEENPELAASIESLGLAITQAIEQSEGE